LHDNDITDDIWYEQTSQLCVQYFFMNYARHF